ncbi:MAG: DUF4432 family protein [Bacillota bacterium]|nr:DUF4432 family protein [Bacillota bacterium]
MVKPERNYGCRWSEWEIKGLRAIVLENQLLRVTILQDKGTDIYEFLYKQKDIDFMWRSPQGLTNPYRQLPLAVPQNSFFMDYYQGGWQEVFPNGGNACSYLGADLGQHGEVALLSWDKVIIVDEPEEVSIKFWVRTVKTPFYLEKTFTIREGISSLAIEERLVNEGRFPMQYMWGHHPAIGKPFLNEYCLVQLPGGTVITGLHQVAGSRLVEGQRSSWPFAKGVKGEEIDLSRLMKEGSGYQDMCFITDLTEAWYRIINPVNGVTFGLEWDIKEFPNLWFWQENGSKGNYPWYGRAYCVALEPFNCKVPVLKEAAAANEAGIIGPGEEKRTWLKVNVAEGTGGIKNGTS